MSAVTAPSVTSGAFWTNSPERLCSALECGIDGLDTAAAQSRLLRLGPNSDLAPQAIGVLRAFARRLLEPLSLILLTAAVVSVAEEFRTAWFLQSTATQILVIFIIRTNVRSWSAFPSPAIAASSLLALAVAMALPFTLVGAWFGFRGPPTATLATAGGLTALYLVSAELLKPFAIVVANGPKGAGVKVETFPAA